MKLVSEQNKTLDEHKQKVMWRREVRYTERKETLLNQLYLLLH